MKSEPSPNWSGKRLMPTWPKGQRTQPQHSIRPSALFLISKFLTGTSGIVADLLVDTDVFIDHLRGSRKLEAEGQRLHYSVVTRCELFAGQGTQEETIRALLAPFEEIPIDRTIAERAGRIRRAGGLRTPDALIAATAAEHGLMLVTRNVRDFMGVREVTIREPR
ncbi:MAG TPA: type II toxin-antitoxin system VapC family toxin [Candidatus Acidoferrum sp.]|nr:type II toxin-antitoxin system VapC family toxin [Candidatus Acidoferrum sp.]